MEFKSITITNFLSYYDVNEIEFAPTTTIFIGQNNTGKSKLFDAINFALYSRVFLTDSTSDGTNGKWISDIKEISTFVVNNHKLNEALAANNDSLKVAVSLLIDNQTSFITVERNIDFKKNEEKYVYATNNFSVTELDKLDGHVISNDVGEAAEDRLSIYFAPSIKDFFLFQGESANRIMQLQKGGNFSLAVKEIARLSVFEDAKDLAESYVGTVHNRITRKQNKNKEQKEQQEKLQFSIETKKKQLEEYDDKKDEADKNVAEYTDKVEELEEELSKLKEFEDYFKQKKTFEDNMKRIKSELNEANSEKSDIAEDAVFYKIREKIAEFKDFYSKLEEKGEVPPSISAAEINKALKAEICPICGADLHEGTSGCEYAKSRLPKCDTDKLGSYLRDLNSTFGNANEDIQSIPQNLENILKRKRQLEQKKTKLLKEKEELQGILDNTKINADTEEKKKKADEVRQSLSHYSDLLEKAKSDSSKNEGSINVLNKELRNLQHDFKMLVVDDDDIDDRDKILTIYAEKLKNAMNKLYTLAHDTAYNEVQEKANEYYKEMTKENAALVGDIKIDTSTSEIYTVDEQGYRIRNINQGNRISIQLAVIAGILTVAQEQFDQQYPFVTDAPVSTLGGDNKLSTVETMINCFEQSIIIIKDDTSTKNKTNDEIRKLIKESDNVGLAYELSLSKAENISDQYTTYKKIKG